MSQSYSPTSSNDDTGTLDAVAAEGAELQDTVREDVSDVVSTAKEEASHVVDEAQSQARSVYRQAQTELREQAGVQQKRVASGIRSVGEELDGMANSSDDPGVAADIVRQVSGRLGGVAEWLDARDPGSLLTEVTAYARRKPGMFIAGAAVAGIVAGRLTRAFAGHAADDTHDGSAAGHPDARDGAPDAVPGRTPAHSSDALGNGGL